MQNWQIYKHTRKHERIRTTLFRLEYENSLKMSVVYQASVTKNKVIPH
jgi:hypothetical protein